MPGGDRTGPRGFGPMTGWGGGYCISSGYGYGRGAGFGYCRGYRGFGWGRFPEVPVREPAKDRLMALKEEERWLEDQLKALKEEVKEMEKEQDKD